MIIETALYIQLLHLLFVGLILLFSINRFEKFQYVYELLIPYCIYKNNHKLYYMYLFLFFFISIYRIKKATG